VISALDAYRHTYGQYPDNLGALVPTYLPSSALNVPTREQEHYPLQYERSDSAYVLTFRYVGPGMNVCRYASLVQHWACSGHF
jgi:hypothetical protein